MPHKKKKKKKCSEFMNSLALTKYNRHHIQYIECQYWVLVLLLVGVMPLRNGCWDRYCFNINSLVCFLQNTYENVLQLICARHWNVRCRIADVEQSNLLLWLFTGEKLRNTQRPNTSWPECRCWTQTKQIVKYVLLFIYSFTFSKEMVGVYTSQEKWMLYYSV